MGQRELRPVALGWGHPVDGLTRDGRPRYKGLLSRESRRRMIEYNAQHPEDAEPIYEDEYMPEIPEGTPYGWALYETTSEGTPISPVFTDLEELARWCAVGATVFADHKWTAEQWLASFRSDTTDVDSLLILDRSGMHVPDPLRRKS